MDRFGRVVYPILPTLPFDYLKLENILEVSTSGYHDRPHRAKSRPAEHG